MNQRFQQWTRRFQRAQWGLKQGMIGARQATLSPSLAALGRTTYLQETDFLKMLALASMLHLLVIGAASLWPEEKVTDIPVRALTFKIGAGTRIRPLEIAGAEPVAPQPIRMTPSTPGEWRAAARAVKPQPKPQPKPVKKPKVVPVTDTPYAGALQPAPQVTPPAQPVLADDALPDTTLLTSHAAVAANPQRFIREAPGQETVPTAQEGPSPAQQAQAARERYEREISGWIQRHKYYPANAGGREGRAVIRMRIDRSGFVRYYAIEESSGVAALDAAAIDMIRRANPMPPVPSTYPAGNLIEFLIPIVFHVPA